MSTAGERPWTVFRVVVLAVLCAAAGYCAAQAACSFPHRACLVWEFEAGLFAGLSAGWPLLAAAAGREAS